MRYVLSHSFFIFDFISGSILIHSNECNDKSPKALELGKVKLLNEHAIFATDTNADADCQVSGIPPDELHRAQRQDYERQPREQDRSSRATATVAR